jgi:hypothetical protein
MGSLTLQTHQDPILLLPWLWFEGADQTLTHLATTHHAGVVQKCLPRNLHRMYVRCSERWLASRH